MFSQGTRIATYQQRSYNQHLTVQAHTQLFNSLDTRHLHCLQQYLVITEEKSDFYDLRELGHSYKSLSVSIPLCLRQRFYTMSHKNDTLKHFILTSINQALNLTYMNVRKPCCTWVIVAKFRTNPLYRLKDFSFLQNVVRQEGQDVMNRDERSSCYPS